MEPSHFNLLSSLPEPDRFICPFSLSSLLLPLPPFLSLLLFFPLFLGIPSQFCTALSGARVCRSEEIKMNHCAIQQNSYAACEEIWASAAAAAGVVGGRDKRETVVCPKPRRLGLIHSTLDPSYARPLRWHLSHQQEDYDAKAGNELLDIILTKGGSGPAQSVAQVALASSPPFFSGSPPSRVSNPLIQDARFGDDKVTPVSPRSIPNPIPSGLAHSPSSSARKGGCTRGNFGNKPAVRIEGFDCLDRDRRNCSIPAWA